MIGLLAAKHDAPEELRFYEMLEPTPKQKVILENVYKIENYTNAIKLMLPFMKERGFLDAMI
jgi:hypothetical protein